MHFTLPFIQVAGIHDAAEAGLLLRCGIRYLGFPLRLDTHAEDLSDIEAAQIIAGLPEQVHAVLITYLDTAGDILDLLHFLGCTIVQLHGDIASSELQSLRRQSSGLGIIKSLVVRENNLHDLKNCMAETAGMVDAYITDTYDPESGASGATGKTHDWAISRELAAISPRPLILAGGLTAENVESAIHAVRPFGVDVHTGVEGPDGRKSAALVQDFAAKARAALGRRQAKQ